jgi:hypothetical protein
MFAIFGLLLWTQDVKEEEALLLLAFNLSLSKQNHHPTKGSVKDMDIDIIYPAPPLDCDDFLRSIRHNSSNGGGGGVVLPAADPNDQKVFANYMTNYDPPFWISNHQDDRLTFRTGRYDFDIYNHTCRFEQLLLQPQPSTSTTTGERMLVFVNLYDDWGWYPLLGASKGNNVVVVQQQQPGSSRNSSDKQGNKQHVIRLCEAARLNRWRPATSTTTTTTEEEEEPSTSETTTTTTTPSLSIYTATAMIPNPLESLIQTWMLQPSQQQQQEIAILKVEGPDIAAKVFDGKHFKRLLASRRIHYLWLEWMEYNDANTIVQQVLESKTYRLYWPAVVDEDSSTMTLDDNETLIVAHIRKHCPSSTSSCSLWWKRI